MRKQQHVFFIPYLLWIALFVMIPLVLLGYQSLLGSDGTWSFENIQTFFTTSSYLILTVQSFFYAALITVITLAVSYPTAYLLSKAKRKQLWLLLLILPTWINVLLKAYAFIGLFSQSGSVNNFLEFIGIGRQQILFTNVSFLLVATYIEIPFMILPIYNAIEEIHPSMIHASRDLGADTWSTFKSVIFPLSLSGVKSGIQAVFIPSLSLFMLTRLIAGNRVITLGTAIEQHFLVTQNWGMGSTMGIVLVCIMVFVMWLTGERKKDKGAKSK